MDSNITTETSQTPAIQLGWDCGNNIFLLNDEKDAEERMYRVINMKGLVKLDTRREEISKRVYETLGLRLEFPKDDVYTPVLSTTENAVILTKFYKKMTVEKTVAELEFALNHNLEFTFGSVPETLTSEQIQEVCDRLNIDGGIYVNTIKEGSYNHIIFYKGTPDNKIGNYIGNTIR